MRFLSIFPALVMIVSGARGSADGIVQEIDKAQEDRDARLIGYTVTEHYTIHNSRFSEPADAVVEAVFTKGAGKTYRVTSRSGPSFLHTHVLDRILKEEEAMSKGETRKSALITSANYQVKYVGPETLHGRACELVEITPRKKSAHLLKGKAWLDAESHMLVQIHGKPTASPAFLAGIPEVTREYIDIEGFSLARTSHAKSQTFLLGKTDLTIEYSDYRVNVAGVK